jgi:hypothetical protein
MRALEAEFAADLRYLEEEFETERTEIVNAHTRQRKDMGDMIAAMEGEFADAEAELRQVRAVRGRQQTMLLGMQRGGDAGLAGPGRGSL